MMHLFQPRRISPLFVLAGLLMLAGCGTTPPSKFYMLESVSASAAEPELPVMQSDVHIGVGPIQFADYLDRTQIVTRTDDAEVILAETHRWVEPLKENFGRILAENLSTQLHTDKVLLHPSRNWSEIDYQVLVNVWQFDASTQGIVTLLANWSLRGKGGAQLLAMKKSVFSVQVESAAPYSDIVRALSETVGMLSQEIARAIQTRQGV
jgi:uncharacterized lipoprotein YmbA